MPGIEKHLIVGQPKETVEEVSCGICHDILTDPKMTSCCRKTFCSECIIKCLNESKFCPNCRVEHIIENLVPVSLTLTNLLSGMTAKCCFHARGCTQVLKLDQHFEHKMYCPSNPEKLCRSCRHRDVVGHNCCENLSKDIIELKLKFREEIQEMRNQLKQKSSKEIMKNIIGKAKENRNNYKINYLSETMGEEMSNGLIELCREVLSRDCVGDGSENEFFHIARHIKETLRSENRYNHHKWRVEVRSDYSFFEWLDDTLAIDIYLSIQFADLIIDFIGFQPKILNSDSIENSV